MTRRSWACGGEGRHARRRTGGHEKHHPTPPAPPRAHLVQRLGSVTRLCNGPHRPQRAHGDADRAHSTRRGVPAGQMPPLEPGNAAVPGAAWRHTEQPPPASEAHRRHRRNAGAANSGPKPWSGARARRAGSGCGGRRDRRCRPGAYAWVAGAHPTGGALGRPRYRPSAPAAATGTGSERPPASPQTRGLLLYARFTPRDAHGEPDREDASRT
jgi:hypothetical protein